MALFGKSDIKKIGEGDGLTVFELGQQLYFFSPHSDTKVCIISAHGGRDTNNANRFTVPTDTILRFYSDDKNSVIDPGFGRFYRSEAAPKEIISEGEICFDYGLTKYQGRHNKMKETYASIARTIRADFAHLKAATGDLSTAQSKGAPDRVQNALRRIIGGIKLPAVVTIRNRYFRPELTLSEVIAAVKSQAPNIMLFDCSFCRSVARGGSDKVELVSRN